MKWPILANTRERTDYFHVPITLYQMISFLVECFSERIYCFTRLQGMVSSRGLVIGCFLRVGRVKEGDMEKDEKREEDEEREEKRLLVKVSEFLPASQLHVPTSLPASAARLLNHLSVTLHLPSFFSSFPIIL